MKYDDIRGLSPINDVDPKKVEELKASMRTHGWVGAPILYTTYGLVTGSHRKAALDSLRGKDWYNLGSDEQEMIQYLLDECPDIAEDVTDLVDAYMEETGKEWDDIDFADLGRIFTGTWVEEYKDSLIEW